MYTNAKVNNHSIKLIFDSRSADSIITQQLMDQLSCQVDHAVSTRIIITDEVIKTPIDKIDNFPFEVNSIIISIKLSLRMTGCIKPMLCSTETPKNCSLARTATIHACQSFVHTKFSGPISNTTSYYQYFLGMTKEKKKRRHTRKRCYYRGNN
ncbi:hypothetical protein G9A89_003344 [Geosiphon pyriformis]|nr:hypothetical protein G9A89_003344 [Geosiphon pyriformis]